MLDLSVFDVSVFTCINLGDSWHCSCHSPLTTLQRNETDVGTLAAAHGCESSAHEHIDNRQGSVVDVNVEAIRTYNQNHSLCPFSIFFSPLKRYPSRLTIKLSSYT